MAIYHLEAKVISRGAGRSAVAAAAYMSCSKIFNDYDGILHDYTRKQGLVWQDVFLPQYAPQEWTDRSVLWNAVEENERTKDSRLAREFVAALPIELNKREWINLLTEFIQARFVADGMCADVAIHDTDGHNPHAHIMLTVRPLDEQGKWQYKTEKEYLCVRNGEEQGFTAAEFKMVKAEGWEKQYSYKVGRKRAYLPPSEAEKHGYERASKYPKSTKFGRQNPISERWNSDEQFLAWREGWANAINLHLERMGRQERIDHRSHAERGMDEQPTIHEGVTARVLEKKGIISDRCEINRQIRADNALLRELKATVKKLMQAVKNTIPALAEALETLRGNMLIFRYQFLQARRGRSQIRSRLNTLIPALERYAGITKRITETGRERKNLLDERKALPAIRVRMGKELAGRIAELTEGLEELRSERNRLLHTLECADDAGVHAVEKDIAGMKAWLTRLKQQEIQYADALSAALAEYRELQERAAELDEEELERLRRVLRPEKEKEVEEKLRETYGEQYSPVTMYDSRLHISGILGEKAECSVRECMRRERREGTPERYGQER